MIPLFDAAAFGAQVRTASQPLAVFRNALKKGHHALKQAFYNGTPVTDLVLARAELVDQLLLQAWQYHLPNAEDLALVAVGGYGRGELHPGSDIDIMILLPQERHAAPGEGIERFLTFLWDIGLEVGHSVRTLAECIEQGASDITIATNLMESRRLYGSRALYQQMCAATGPDSIWPSRAFFEAKWREQISRHHKFNDTAYNLEPNIKEGPGGLRDIQMIGWVAKRHFGAATMHDLVNHGFLTESEYHQLGNGQNFLWKIRFALHTITGRREDRLLFDHQRHLAQLFGYQDSNHRMAVEHFMKDYYRTIMELARLNEMLLQLFQEEILYADEIAKPAPINGRFQSRKGFIEACHQEVFKRYPFALLEIFLVSQQNPALKGIRAGTIRLMRNHRYLIDDNFRNDLRCKTLFMEILRQPHGVTRELRRMNRYGILAAYLPEFGTIVGQMQHDLFHVYTVDEHTLFVLRNLRRFSVLEYAHEFPMCSSIFQRVPKTELLYIASLYHDIAKGRGGDHSELGAIDAEAFCVRHNLSGYDARLVAWLVRSHLLMSTTAQRKDLSDPAVIHEFASTVGNQSRLDYLYLLTVADIRATSPKVWNSWKDALLIELYNATTRALRHGLENPLDQSDRVQYLQDMALELLANQRISKQQAQQVWQRLSNDYFIRHSADEIAWHTQAILNTAPQDLPLVMVRQRTKRGGTEIFIYAQDQDYLFAHCTAAFEQLDLTVADARIITSRDGYTLDTFIVLEASGEPITDGFRIQEIMDYLPERLRAAHAKPEQVSRHLSRRLKHFPIPTEVGFQEDPDNGRTIMEVTTSDRPGLLARIGLALAQCEIRLQNAKIATLGERVEDIFFITDRHNRPLSRPEQYEALRSAIVKFLEQ